MELDWEKRYPLVWYGEPDDDGTVYIRLCPHCGRFVKADDRSGPPSVDEPNATCARCGRVKMPFYGWQADLVEEVEE